MFFTILGDEMSFMIGGGCDITKVYVELLIEGEGKSKAKERHANGAL